MKTFKSILSYLGCICITVGVAYFIDGTAGIILTCALLCALVLSTVLTLFIKRFIRIEISADKTLLSKGDTMLCAVKLSKSIPIPSPVIEIEADCTAHFMLEKERIFKGALAGTETNVIKIPFKAMHSGRGEVSVTQIRLTDYLGIFSFKMSMEEENRKIKAAIYPDIPDAAVQTDFLKTASQFADSDDEEEESDETAIGATGMPGYDHRLYYPGDPIKRINWKLSSKRDVYMVRLDEKVCGAGQMFFLDCPKMEETEFVLSVRDNVIEGALAMFTMLIREGREATFFRYEDNLWLRTDIRSIAEVYALQEQLSSFTPDEPSALIPPEILNAGKTPICFTAALGDNPSSAISIASVCPDSLIISSSYAALPLISPNLWTVSQEFELKPVHDA